VGIGIVVADSGEAERRSAQGEAVILARPTTSPDDLHGMIGASAVITEEGGSTSHAAVVSRALGIPCVVGCGAGKLQALTGRTMTVDAGSGSVYAGTLEIVVPDERADPCLAVITRWAQQRSPLKVLRPAQAPRDGVADLTQVQGAADPILIGRIIAGLRSEHGVRGVRGGAAASDEGIRAAVAAGLEFVVAEPVLPALLAAVHADVARRQPDEFDRGDS
jgi:pyruvate,orthophosphate dikinase